MASSEPANPTTTTTDVTDSDEPISFTHCLLCHRPLSAPKLLPCGHLVCRHCLVTWLQAEPEAVCPHAQCHYAILDVKKEGNDLAGKRAEEVADGFPTDLAMEVLVEAEKTLSEVHLCCVCNVSDDGDDDDDDDNSVDDAISPVSKTRNSTPLTPVTSPSAAGGKVNWNITSSPKDNNNTASSFEEAKNSSIKISSSLEAKNSSVKSSSSLEAKNSSVKSSSSLEANHSSPKEAKNSSGGSRGAVPAAYYCLHCGDAFCPACSTVHRRQRATRQHALHELSTLTVETLAASSFLKPEMCQLHKDQAATLYCPSHDAVVCMICRATGEHRKCAEVTSAEQSVKQARAELEEAESVLKTSHEELERGLQELQHHLRQTEQRTKEAESEIDKTCDALQDSVNSCRRRLKDRVSSTRSDVTTAVNGRMTYFLLRQQLTASYEEAVQRTKGLPTLRSIQIMATILKARVLDLDLTVPLPKDARIMSAMTLTIDPQAVTRINEELSKLGRVGMEAKFHFHSNHGKNVVLSNNSQSAQKTSIHRNNGIVMSRDPMFTNMLYEVRIEKIQPEYTLTRVGIVTEQPSEFTELPNTFFCSDQDVLCLDCDGAYVFGQKRSVPWTALKDVGAGSRVGLAIDSDRCLHLYVNGQEKGIVVRDLPDTCFFMFDLFARCTKVTALPVTTI